MGELNEQAIEKLLEKREIDKEEVDYRSIWDNSLTQKENFNLLREHLNKNFPNSKPDEEIDLSEYIGQKQEHNKEMVEKEKEELQREQRQSIKQIAENENTDIQQHYKFHNNYVEMVADGDANAYICKSNAGLGKTYQTLNKLQKKGLEINQHYKLINTYSTPLEFYRTLYRNKDKVLVLDDIEGVLSSKEAVSMLKSALWSTTGNREIQYRSTKLPSDLPDKFEFKGGVIMLVNELNMKGENMEALKNRCLYHELNFSHKEKFELMSKIANKDLDKDLDKQEKHEVLEYLQELVNESHRLNIRNLMKSLDIYRTRDSWKELVKNQLEYDKDSDLEVLKEITEQGYDKVKKQVKEFRKETGKSRKTFYRYKKKLRNRGEI